jgi:hypothetical protein
MLLLLLLQMPLDDIQNLMDETAEAKEYQVGSTCYGLNGVT